MEYKRIDASQIDMLWELQKQYKAEIGENVPDDIDKIRLIEAISNEKIFFYGVWADSSLVGCCSVTVGFSTFDYMPSGVSSMTVGSADCDIQMYQSLGFSIHLGNLLAISLQ